MKQSMQVLTSSETDEWYTPPEIIEAVNKVLGYIELDPASHWIPQEWIKAERYFDAAHNALLRPWVANTLFLNPPYGKTGNLSNQDIWMQYLISQLPTIGACIALTKSTPGYWWFDNLFRYSWPGPVCITEGRISFISQVEIMKGVQGEKFVAGKAKAATALWYYGPNPRRFRDVFNGFGRVIPPEALVSQMLDKYGWGTYEW